MAEAELLLAAGRWSGAYYLIGYAIKCGLKACVLAYVERSGAILLDKKFSEKCWTHNFKELIRLADLDVAYDASIAANPQLNYNWRVAHQWNESSRYQQWDETTARSMYIAVTDFSEGVLSWIKTQW